MCIRDRPKARPARQVIHVLERRFAPDQHRRNLPVEDVRLNADHHDVPVVQALSLIHIFMARE